MTFRLLVFPSADADVDELAAYIADDSIQQAIRFYDAVQATYQMILEAPNRWAFHGFTSARLANLRKRSVLGFPNHFVFYRVETDLVEVVRLLHGARDFPTVFEDVQTD